MGQKVNPIGIRLGIIRESDSRWFPETRGAFAKTLRNDIDARLFIQKRIPEAAGLSKILIERTGRNVRITLRVAKPGVIIGKKGEDVDKLRTEISQAIGFPVHLNIEEIRKPELDAALVAKNIAQQLERRVMFRRAMKRAVTTTLRLGAKGIKISVSGRLGGAEIARREVYHEGSVPLHTFRADIDYATASAQTTYGVIGVKVWIFKGEIIGKQPEPNQPEGSS
jgi:small subunit ribosomal protein S3